MAEGDKKEKKDDLLYTKQRRNAIRSNAKKELKNGYGVIGEDHLDVLKLSTCVVKLKDYRERLQELDKTVIMGITDEKMGEEVEISVKFDDEILEAIGIFTCHIEQSKLSPPPSENGDTCRKDSVTVKLPKLQIDQYDGDSLKYQEFWDSFSSTVHENTKLSEIEKFKYLRSFLEGDALSLVEGYRLTAANYAEVVSALRERFGNTQLARFAHFEALLSLSCSSAETKQLRSVYDACERHIRSLVVLGLKEDTFGEVFCPIILSKLPWSVRMELNRRNGAKAWELSALRQLLKDELVVREMSQAIFPAQPCSNDSYRAEKQGRDRAVGRKCDMPSGNRGSASALLSNSGARPRSDPSCAYCSQPHFSDECTVYPDVASRQAKLGNRCSSCLHPGHEARACRWRRKCYHCREIGHHRSLCISRAGDNTTAVVASNQNFDQTRQGTNSCTSSHNQAEVSISMIASGQRAIMQTALANVASGDGSTRVQTRILLDTGSSRTFVTQRVRDKLGLRTVGHEIIAVAGFGDKQRKSHRYPVVEFIIVACDDTAIRVTANVTSVITCPIQRYALEPRHLSAMQHVALADSVPSETELVEIDVLIGCDYYHDIILPERIQCSGGLLLLNSRLGFVLAGRVEDLNASNKHEVMIISHEQSDNFDLEKLWRIEDIGIKDKSPAEDDEALRIFSESIEIRHGRYFVQWPWKDNAELLPVNRQLAWGRFRSLLRKLRVSGDLLDKYHQIIMDQCNKGIIEVAPSAASGKIHYIPHHAVVTPGRATTKVRIVYDASAKASRGDVSLNECLCRGPVLLSDMCGVIIRFRLHRFGLLADVEKAYLQIGLKEHDRDATRFFWLRDPCRPLEADNVTVFRFCRIPFGFKPCSFLLDAVISHHLKATGTKVAVQLDLDHYADNVATGCSTAEDAVAFYDESKQIFSSACMNLREWFSNCPVLAAHIPAGDRGASRNAKVLGMVWDTSKDSIGCAPARVVDSGAVVTKRQCLATLASFFDPCGILSPISIVGKMIMQELWQAGCGWDDPIPGQFVSSWQLFLESFREVQDFQIPRWVLPDDPAACELQLHCFCDASENAYAAAVYLRAGNSSITSGNLVFAKARVSPLKPRHTVPRLELLAIVVGCRILSFVEREIKLPTVKMVIWSDAQCVLHWILRDRVQAVFVKKRILEIRSFVKFEFRYVPSEDNPADLPSRGADWQRLFRDPLWWHGPAWLVNPENTWPQWPDMPAGKIDSSNMLINGPPSVVLTASPEKLCSASPLVDIAKFSTLGKLLRVTAYVFRFVRALQKNRVGGQLTPLEVGQAQSWWVRQVQMKNFPPASTSAGNLSSLGLFWDDQGFLRCRGRIDNAVIGEDAKYPKLLPKKNLFTDLVIRSFHEAVSHAGVSHTLSQIRFEFWIPQGRSQVKRVLSSCKLCRKISGGPFRIPKMPPLPDFRVGRAKPFECVGLDYFGPLYIRQSADKPQEKVWVCLYTCANIRAVHLEAVESMSAQDFLLAFRRFAAIHRCPQLVISDNAKQFQSAGRALRGLLCDINSDPLVQSYVAKRGITWKFIPEFAPWMGGFYERLVGVCKIALRKSLDSRCVSLVEMQTLLAEVARVVNSRPLVYVGEDIDQPALTPSHFLGGYGPAIPLHPELSNSEDPEFVSDPNGSNLLVNWRRNQNALDSFWKVWVGQYLLSLRESHRPDQQRGVESMSPVIGTTVLIRENSLPRGSWKMGLIVHCHLSRDGLCRSATLRLGNGKCIRRPIKLLYPLEISGSNCTQETGRRNGEGTPARDPEPARRPVRQSAKLARSKIRYQVQQDLLSNSSDSE